jgi:hypothetical protein
MSSATADLFSYGEIMAHPHKDVSAAIEIDIKTAHPIIVPLAIYPLYSMRPRLFTAEACQML